MTYMFILKCALKLVLKNILYYDARSEKHQNGDERSGSIPRAAEELSASEESPLHSVSQSVSDIAIPDFQFALRTHYVHIAPFLLWTHQHKLQRLDPCRSKTPRLDLHVCTVHQQYQAKHEIAP